MTADEKKEIHARIDEIHADVKDIKRSGNWTSGIQLTALFLFFIFGIATFKELKKKLL